MCIRDRGLGYYTGPVFEIKLAEGIGTVIAGGRYDSLLSLYGQSEPATGISVGIERLITLMLERKKGTKKTNSKIFVAAVKPEFYKHALATAAEFHKAGVQCETDLNERNLRKQLDYANALAIPFAAIVGEREVTEKKVMFRDMFSGKEELLSIQEAITKVKGR